MGKYFSSVAYGLFKGGLVFLVAGLLLIIPFMVWQPLEPMAMFGVALLLVAVVFALIWSKQQPKAQRETEEGIKAGAVYAEADDDPEKESPLKRFHNSFYPKLFTGLMAACMFGCSYDHVYKGDAGDARVMQLVDTEATPLWEAGDIEMVHLKDSMQYVTNPEGVLSQETVDRLNASLRKLDTEADVKSAVVVVRKLKYDDAAATAGDLVSMHKIGSLTSGMGVCVVVSYDQHNWAIAPSRKLEPLLTDVECNHLGTYYIVPYMKKEMPDSAMLCMVDQMCNLISAKKAGETVELQPLKSDNTGTWTNGGLIALLCAFYGILNRQNRWEKSSKRQKVADVPVAAGGPKPAAQRPEKKDEKPAGGHYGGGEYGGGGASGRW